ncbi:hypothetical protein [Flavobacterium mesophilum]|uniref:hypothetical protein n=1 Tax=Flavobacterium mesophilum TaxID=3143495 RepID=UPI0031E271F5
MKFLKITILLFTIAFSSTKLAAQQKEEQIIKAVSFETDKIILNNKIAYNYINASLS